MYQPPRPRLTLSTGSYRARSLSPHRAYDLLHTKVGWRRPQLRRSHLQRPHVSEHHPLNRGHDVRLKALRQHNNPEHVYRDDVDAHYRTSAAHHRRTQPLHRRPHGGHLPRASRMDRPRSTTHTSGQTKHPRTERRRRRPLKHERLPASAHRLDSRVGKDELAPHTATVITDRPNNISLFSIAQEKN